MTFELPELGYEYDALVPFIDEKTMKLHHQKHHQTYIDKLNKALTYNKRLQRRSTEKLILNWNRLPKEIRQTVRNNAGGHYNHSFFWKTLKKDIKPNNEILKLIKKDFGSFDYFKSEFSSSALNLFGSGWTWLVLDEDKLKITNTSNQDNPITDGQIPLLGLDLWEHAYYLKYQNKRAEYIESFFKIINWDQINFNLIEAKNKTFI